MSRNPYHATRQALAVNLGLQGLEQAVQAARDEC
jgi:hypothetical protein